MFLLVDSFEVDADKQSGNAEAGQHDQRHRVVELMGSRTGGVGLVEHLANQQREEPF